MALRCIVRGNLATPTLGLLFSLALVSIGSGQAGGSWQTLRRMPSARQEISTAVLNGKIYVIAGFTSGGASTDTVEVYDPATDTWAAAKSIPLLNNHNNAATAAGKLYTFGGVSKQAFVYNPANDSWSPVASMNMQHGSTAAVGVIDNKIYVAGGTNSPPNQRGLEVYDPATNKWTTRAPMTVSRNHCAGAVIDGKFYVVGGRGADQAPTALEVYDPATNSWSTRASMPTGRSGLAAASVNGELFVFGGEFPDLHSEVEVYNPISNTWRELPNMPTPRHGIWASVIGNKIYLPAGGQVQGYGATNVNEVFTVGDKATLVNISTRARVETGDNVLIGGFVVSGPDSKRVIIRAIGPTLPVPGPLTDPVLELYNGANQLVLSNDNWQEAPNPQEIIDSNLAPMSALESAILTNVAPGNHTAIVRGAGGTSGVALVEVYVLENSPLSQLINISSRGFVSTGDNLMIAGFVATGDTPRRFLVRAMGPSLPVPGPLANPNLELRDANGALLAANDDWRNSQEAEIMATKIAPASNLESAIVRTLAPGLYTALMRGAFETIGIGLVEVYALQ